MGNVNIIKRSEYKGLSDGTRFIDIKLAVSNSFTVSSRDDVIYFGVRPEGFCLDSDISDMLAEFGDVYSKEISAALDKGISHLFINLPVINFDENAYENFCFTLNYISLHLISVQNIDITFMIPDNKAELYSALSETESDTHVARYGCKCTKCGNYFMLFDAQENFRIDTGIIGYGSQYDECSIKIDLCTDCFDELMQTLIPDCIENPVSYPDD